MVLDRPPPAHASRSDWHFLAALVFAERRVQRTARIRGGIAVVPPRRVRRLLLGDCERLAACAYFIVGVVSSAALILDFATHCAVPVWSALRANRFACE